MFHSLTVIAVFCLYMGLVFCLALWTERRQAAGKSVVSNPLVYSLSLAVYATTWTYYGSVGLAATSGLLFLTVYLGPTLIVILWWVLLRKLVRLKEQHHITSIADFISVRYEKSETLAAAATLIAMFGTVPYIALQLKAVFSTFAIITGQSGPTGHWIGSHVGPIVVGLMVVFTIIFGVRRLDPTERHEGMVMVVAAESVVKLVLFVAAGLFVVYGLYDGVEDIFARFTQMVETGRHSPIAAIQPETAGFLTWTSYIILAASAVMLLPRQFHIAVVENTDERHIKTAMWMFPLYMFLINIFVYPIAMAGILEGYPATYADTYVLRLPLDSGHSWLALMVFLGGFSAGTSMILITSMTMATMISNHLLLPLVDWIPALGFIERQLLKCRWLVVALFIFMGYQFERLVGEQFMLVNIGMISFAAILQLAPAVLGGIFWKSANGKGAMAGMTAGFTVWTYTLLLPAFVKSGWVASGILQDGPLGISWLRPEALFGTSSMDPVSHTVFWSLLANVFFYVLGSLRGGASHESQSHAEAFVGVMSDGEMFTSTARREAYIAVPEKRRRIETLLRRYFDQDRAVGQTERAMRSVGVWGKERISITELAELYSEVERGLAGSVGSAVAHRALGQAGVFTPHEAQELSEVYGEILASLRARPEDLKRTIDFYQEREVLMKRHADELEEKVVELELEIARRRRAEAQMRESEERYRKSIEYSSDGVAIIVDDRFIYANKKFVEIFGYARRREVLGQHQTIIVHPDDRQRVMDISRLRSWGHPVPDRYDFMGLKKDGTAIYVAVSATVISYRGEDVNLAYLRDVTARRMAEEEIRHLSRRLIAGIEDEKKRLAADLHDEFGQSLTALRFGVEGMRDALPEDDQRRQRVARLLGIIEGLADNIRRISTELRPDMLDHLGLIPTFQWFVDDFNERLPKLAVEFQAVGFKRRLPPRQEIILYRILQEALNNAAKHSGATRVEVMLTYSHPNVIMLIRDNGRGFDAPTGISMAVQPRASGGIGLLGMRERVASVDGTVDIRSRPGQGTTIRVSLPVAPEALGPGPEEEEFAN